MMSCSMKFTFSALLLASSFIGAAAQGSSPLTNILAALQAENLTTLATVAQGIVNTTTGQQVLSILSSGRPVTVFAPDNNAFTGVPKNISDDPELLAQVLSYHVIPGTFDFSFFGSNGNTVLRTALNASTQVFLDQGQNQVLVGRKNGANVKILNQNTDVESYNSTQISGTNVTLNKVNAVIDLPGAFDALFTANNLSAFSAAALQAGILPLLNFTHGITIFAPTNDAFEKALAQLGGATNISQTTLKNVLLNHVLNGTVVYSSELSAGNTYISAAGEQLKITSSTSSNSTNSTGLGISSGNSNATILTTDLISWSGSLHVIDTVLLNNATDPSAASSAFASATASAASAASVEATATTPVGGLVGSAGSGASATGSARGGAPSKGSAVSDLRVGSGVFGFISLLSGLVVLY